MQTDTPSEIDKRARYGRATAERVRNSRAGWWQVTTPDGHVGSLSPEVHQVVEHGDGTITVSPSIDMSKRHPGAWHGYLRFGVFEACVDGAGARPRTASLPHYEAGLQPGKASDPLSAAISGGIAMGQVSAKLRRVERGYSHWCPGCEQMHVIFDSWKFDGNLENPTFNPSVKITGKKIVVKDGRWTGEWVRDAEGKPVDDCCHYFLHAGVLKFCGDSLHALAGKSVELPDLPEHLRDGDGFGG